MERMDANCLVGSWPFRKAGRSTAAELRKIHGENGIRSGCVASLNSIFYSDPFEGEEELHEDLKGTEYRQVMTVNPALPGGTGDIAEGVRRFGIAGVRIYPGYHRYALGDPCVAALCAELKKQGLPLFLPLRMEDERLNYLAAPRPLPVREVESFLSEHRDLTAVVLGARPHEIESLGGELRSRPNLYFDLSGLKDGQFNVERLVGEFGDGKLVYGSLYPLYCLKSSLLQVETAEIPDRSKERIFSGNLLSALARPEGRTAVSG